MRRFMAKPDATEHADLVVLRLHCSAMEPCFHDGECLEVNFGCEPNHGSGGVVGVAAGIMICYYSGKNKLIEYFESPLHIDVRRSGYVVRMLLVISARQKVFCIDAGTDTPWRERHRATRKIYAY